MENEKQEQVNVQVEQKSSLHQVTPLSKYLAMSLFVMLPFVGGYVGYHFAPEKIVEVIRYKEKKVEQNFTKEEIENLYFNDLGGIKLIHTYPSIKMTGTVEVSELFDENNEFIVNLDDESVMELQNKVSMENISRNLKFSKSHPVVADLNLKSGDIVWFEITDFYLDTRRIETFNSGALVSIIKL